jgi:hypothetical protein
MDDNTKKTVNNALASEKATLLNIVSAAVQAFENNTGLTVKSLRVDRGSIPIGIIAKINYEGNPSA